MSNKYQVIDSRGATHKRTSAGRTYTHCVVIHFNNKWRSMRSRAEWAGSAWLAEKNAARWRGKSHVEAVDICKAIDVGLERASAKNADHIDGFDRDDLGESPDF
jgi:hypothetical protein